MAENSESKPMTPGDIEAQKKEGRRDAIKTRNENEQAKDLARLDRAERRRLK